MSLQDVVSSLLFWDGNSVPGWVFPEGSSNLFDAPPQVIRNRARMIELVTRLYNESDTMRWVLEGLAANGPIRIGSGSSSALAVDFERANLFQPEVRFPGTGDLFSDAYIVIDENPSILAFNKNGELFEKDPIIILAHELGHWGVGFLDTLTDQNGERPDSLLNLSTYDFAGPSVFFENLIADELGLPLMERRLSYGGAQSSSIFEALGLQVGMSYTRGQVVDIVRLGQRSVDGQGNVADNIVDDIDFSARTDGKSVLVFGFGGEDNIAGNDGNDHLYGGGGDDDITGGSGNDFIYGGDGDDSIFAGPQNLIGNPSASDDDWVDGGIGNDFIEGGVGDDTIEGGDGNDEIYGDEGADRLFGGSGDDLLFADEDDLLVDGGDGRDTADYSAAQGPINLGTVGAQVSGIEVIIGSDFDDTFQLPTAILSGFTGVDAEVEIRGGKGDDAISGNASNNLLYGDEGADTIFGGSGDDTIEGGDNDDTIYGDNFGFLTPDGNDTISGGNGNDFIDGQGGIDVIDGADGNDTIFGGDGDDGIDGGAGADTIDGGSGSDRILGGLGDDTIAGGDEFAILGEGDIIDGGAGNDTIFGGDGSDTLDGGLGDDKINGGSDEDVLRGGSGNDVINAESDDGPSLNPFDFSSADQLWGGAGNDTFLTNDGDTIHDPDFGDRIKLLGNLLTGGTETSSGSRVYEGPDGTTYTLTGSILTVQTSGILGSGFGSSSITIRNFRNGLAGIRLIDAKDDDDDDGDQPDLDEAERNRDPLIIDLDGDRNVIAARDSVAAYFDLNNDGFAERVTWSRAGDGFLVRDLDGNGVIDRGSEMFGTGAVEFRGERFEQFGEDGFIELALLDSNADLVITAADTQFATLKVWVDANLDAITDEGELRTLESLGIVSISLQTFGSDHVPIIGDASIITRASTVGFADGRTTTIYDAYLSIDTFDSRERLNDFAIDQRVADLPFLLGSGRVSDLDVAMSRDAGLAELVREFADLQISDAAQILAKTQQIVLRWTGADQIAPDSRGPNVSAQWLHALEAITGEDFFQARVGTNPRGDAGAIIVNEWQQYISRTAAKLLGQTSLGQALTPGLSFAAAAFFTVSEGTTFESVLANLAASAPNEKGQAIAYWSGVIGVLRQYRSQFGLMPSAFDTQVDAVLRDADIGFTIDDFYRVLTVSEGEEGVVGRSQFVRSDDIILLSDDAAGVDGGAGDDIFLAARGTQGVSIFGGYGEDTLLLADHLITHVSATLVTEDGRTFAEITDASGDLRVRVNLAITPDGLLSDIEKVAFADGSSIDVIQLLDAGQVGSGIVLGSDATAFIEGGAGDEVLIGIGGDSVYRWGPNSGSDRIADRAGAADRIIIDAYFGDVAIRLDTAERSTDVLFELLGTGETLRVLGQRLVEGRAIETFVFRDRTLSLTELDVILNTGTSGDDIIIGSARSDQITGGAGNDLLRGGVGNDNYRFDSGWGEDRILEVNAGNTVTFGPGIARDDISAERGTDDSLVLRSSAGDVLTIVGGLRAPVVSSFIFADGSSKQLVEFIRDLSDNPVGVVQGTPNDDRLVGTTASETLVGGGGRDVFSGNGGTDIYEVSGPISFVTGGVGSDTILAPAGVSLSDLRIDQIFGLNIRFMQANIGIAADSQVEFLALRDGRFVDLKGSLTTGSEDNDFLYNLSGVSTTFTPGAGDDIMIGSSSPSASDNYQFEVGFGNDVIYDLGGINNINFISPELSLANASIDRVGNNLVIAFTSNDTLTVEGYFWRHAYDNNQFGSLSQTGTIGRIFFGGDNSPVFPQAIREMISSRTAGDDWVMVGLAGVLRDGGAGNDILAGGIQNNIYEFREGYGNDLIKDDGGFSDRVRFFGVDLSEITVSRDAIDPYSVVLTLNATGETLTIDGTPEDGFLPDWHVLSDRREWGLTIEEFVFDSGTVSGAEIIDMALASSATAGADIILGLNSEGTINGGQGDDRIDIGNGRESIVIEQDGGHDIVRFSGDGSRSGRGGSSFSVMFAGINRADLVLVEVNEVDGIVGRHLRIIANDSSVTIINGLDPRFNQFGTEVGIGQRFELRADDGEFGFSGMGLDDPLSIPIGRLSPLTQGSEGDDFLQSSPDEPSTVIDPRGGNDVIFSSGAGDTVRFGIGYGVDRYVAKSGSLTIEMDEGLTADDIALTWSLSEPGFIEVSIVGKQDRLIVEAQVLSRILVGGEILTTDPQRFVDPATLPTSSVNPDEEITAQPGAERIVATGGNASIVIGANSGLDFIQDARFEAAINGADNLAGWVANNLIIEGVSGADDLRFFIDDSDPATLIIEKPNGDQITLVNQFGLGMPQLVGGLRAPDIDGDGIADWSQIDLDADGTPDFAALDTSGDGIPDWLNADVSGDGQSDWNDVAYATAVFAGGDVFAEDLDRDNNFEAYFFSVGNISFTARDIDGDGIADEYSLDASVWTPAPTGADGVVDWSLLDLDGNGISDLRGFADGTGPSWLSGYNPQSGDPAWSVTVYGELRDGGGDLVAERYIDLTSGAADYVVLGTPSIFIPPSLFIPGTNYLARDVDGDGTIDLIGIDADGDGQADPGLDLTARAVVASITLRDTSLPSANEFTLSLADILDRIEFVSAPPERFVDLDALRPLATAGADDLLLGSGEQLDSLGGNDRVTSIGAGGVLKWSAGDGNDVFRSTLRFPARAFGTAGDEGTDRDAIRFDGILDPAQLRFSVSAENFADLVIEIIATGERLTIEGQLGPSQGGQEWSPPVGRFIFEGGLELSGQAVAARVFGTGTVIGDGVQRTDDSGGVLDAGAGPDGADMLQGGAGGDIYRFGRDYGEDAIFDAGGIDTVHFGPGISPADLFFSRTGANGHNLLIEVLGLDRLTLTISGQFAGDGNAIEFFSFEDGSRLTAADVQRFILDVAETGANDTITGFLTDDIIRGGRGNDILSGGGGNDQIFGGEGRDQVILTGTSAEYLIAVEGDITTVTDTVAGRDGIIRLQSVEDLVFRSDSNITPIAPANIAPSVGGVALQANEDATLIIAAANLLANAVDANGDRLRLSAVGAALNGQVWIGVDGNVRFLPNADFAGEAGFDFAVSDGNGGVTTARATVSVLGANDTPRIVIADRTVTIFEDSRIDWVLPAGSISDPDGDALTIFAQLSSGAPLPGWLNFDGGRFTGTPPADFNGVLDVVISAGDGRETASTTLRLEVLSINDAPRQVSVLADQIFRPGEAFAFTLPTNTFLDVEGDPLSFDIVSSDGSPLPDWLTIDGLTISGTIPDGQVAPVNLALRASDGASTSIATFAINPAANSAPTVGTQLGPVFGTEDQAFSYTLPDNVFVDADQDSLAITAVLSDGSPLPSWLRFENATFSGTPPQDFNGVLAIRLSATDGRASVSQNFELTINPVNDAPVLLVPLSDAVSPEDTGFSVSIPTATFGDVDGDTLTLSATLASGAPLFDWLRLEGSTVVGNPPRDFNGPIDIVVLASDGLLSATDTFRLTISPTNDAPVVMVPLPDFTVAEDQPIMLDGLTAGFGDVDGDTLSFTLTGANGAALPNWLSLANGRLVGTPPANLNGVFDLELRASDGAQSVVDAFRLTLSPVNDAPVLAQPLTDQTATGNGQVSITVPAGAFIDLDGDALTYTARLADGSALPQWLAFNAASRTFTGTAPNANAALNVRLTASDGSLSASDDFFLTVTAQAENGGSSTGFRQVGLNSWFNPSWGGGYNVTFEYEVQPDAIVDGRLRAWDILASYTGPGTITNGWVSGFPGTTTFQVVPGGARFTNTGQSYQPTLAEGTRFQVSVQVDGAAYNPAHFGLSIFDRDPAFNLADDSDTLLTVAPTSVWAGGLSQNLTLRNTGTASLDGWQVVLDVPTGVTLNITNVWGATATTLANGDIMFRAVSNNESVAAGAQTTFGFNASYTGASTLPLARSMFSFTDADTRQFDAVIASLTGTGVGSNWRYGTSAADTLTVTTTAATRLFGGAGDDTINGNAGADWIAGGSGDDAIYGNGGNDLLWGGAGNDLLYGGAGTDSAYLFGVRSSYSLVTQAGALGLRVTDLGAIAHGDDGIDQLSSIERLVFRGGETINITSPIILDLDGNGVQTLSAADSDARFDLDGDGLADDTSWISAGDAFLYLDRDGNGTMSGVEEISFVDDVPNARTDLAGLAAFDSNNDRILDARDARFADFGVWRDADGDGAVDEGETASLAAVGIRSISLVGTPVNNVTEFGEVAIANTGTFTLTSGTTRSFADAALTYFSAATNLPSLGVTQYDFDRKASKFRISAAGGALTVGSRNARSGIDPLAGQLGANTILTFRDGDYGMFAPVVLDLDGDGVELVSRKKSRASFDYGGDGAADDTGWIGRDDGFLVIDRNNDGLITEASELSLASEDEEARSGLQGLARLDSNGDGVVNSNDARFGELRVWRDRNGDGRTDAGELLTLEQAGVVAIRLNAVTPTQQSVKLDRNVIAATASFVRTNGTTSTVADVSLAYRPVSAPTAPVAAFDLSERFAGFGPDLFLTPREIDRQSRFDQLPSVNELAALLGRADAETISDIFDRVSAAATPDQVPLARQVTIAAQATEAVPLPPRVFDPSSLYFAMYDSIRLTAWRGGVGEPEEVGVLAVAPFEAGQVAYNESGNPDPVLNGALSDDLTPVAGEPRRLLDRSAHELWSGPALIGSLPVSEASAEATPPSIAFVPAASSNSPVASDDARPAEADQAAVNNPHEALANTGAVVAPSTTGRADRPRLDPAQHELWGGPLHVSLIPSPYNDEGAGPTVEARAFEALHGPVDAEIARKLAMIRQDLGTFGAKGVGEVERLRQLPAQAMDIFA